MGIILNNACCGFNEHENALNKISMKEQINTDTKTHAPIHNDLPVIKTEFIEYKSVKDCISPEPSIPQISSVISEFLIDGCTRLWFNKDAEQKIPSEIIKLFKTFYQKESYNVHLMILNNKPLKLAFCNISSNITNNVKILNLKNNPKFDSKYARGIGYKQNFDIDNLSPNIINDLNINSNNKYNAIFKLEGAAAFGDDMDEAFGDIIDVKLLLNSDTDLYCYQLPHFSLGSFEIENNSPIYSQLYGLIVIGPNSNETTKIASLNLSDNDMKWDTKEIKLATSCISPDYCLVNGESKIFITNGEQKKTLIYNMINGRVRKLKDNPYSDNWESVVWYNETTQRVWTIGGMGKTAVYFCDLKYGRFSETSYLPNINYRSTHGRWSKLWTDKSGVIINIATIYPKYLEGDQVYYEWCDDREHKKKWYINENLNETVKQLSNDEEFKYPSIV